MIQPGWNHLDRRPAGALPPRAYCSDPHGFGVRPEVTFELPPCGSTTDLDTARLQHQVFLVWQQAGRHPSTGVLRERWGVSKQVVSRTARGERWVGERLLVAMLTEMQVDLAAGGLSSSHASGARGVRMLASGPTRTLT